MGRQDYPVRIIGVFATRWRAGDVPMPDVELGRSLADYYRRVDDEEPYELPWVMHRHVGQLGVLEWPPEAAPTDVEMLVFSLPFPADQVVVALTVDFSARSQADAVARTERLLEACREARIRIDGAALPDLVAGLGDRLGLVPLPGTQPRQGLPLERHQLILFGVPGDERPADRVVRRLLFGTRLSFTDLDHPSGLNQDGNYGAVTNGASLLCGHPDEVAYSVFLTTVQAVGTASRFQQIWQDAYHQVQEFQEHRQEKVAGVQRREDLETLADHMGNLELDLAFSVQTAADLGLNPSTRIDSFHDALYDAMQIKTRAETVGLMFDRLGGSIRSELTAIESRERQEEDVRRQIEELRRRNGALALTLITVVLAPVTFLLGFFGSNVAEAHAGAHLADPRFVPEYVIAGGLAVAPLVAFYVLQWITRRRRQASRSPRPGD